MEEAAVEARAVRTKLELNRGGTFNAESPGEHIYLKGMNDHITKLKNENANYSPVALQEKGRLAGELALYRSFLSGEFIQSTTGKTYTQALGDRWDKAHGVNSP
jgi:hypothetical protein